MFGRLIGLWEDFQRQKANQPEMLLEVMQKAMLFNNEWNKQKDNLVLIFHINEKDFNQEMAEKLMPKVIAYHETQAATLKSHFGI